MGHLNERSFNGPLFAHTDSFDPKWVHVQVYLHTLGILGDKPYDRNTKELEAVLEVQLQDLVVTGDWPEC